MKKTTHELLFDVFYHHFFLSDQLYQKTMHKEIKRVTSSYFYFLPLNPKVSGVQKVMDHTRTIPLSSSSRKGSSKWKNFHINHHSLQLFPFDKTPNTCNFCRIISLFFFCSFRIYELSKLNAYMYILESGAWEICILRWDILTSTSKQWGKKEVPYKIGGNKHLTILIYVCSFR